MSDPVTPSQLRADIYRLLDRVLETGEPLEIERKGRRLRLVAETSETKVSRIRPIPGLVSGDAGDLASINWSAEWSPDQALEP